MDKRLFEKKNEIEEVFKNNGVVLAYLFGSMAKKEKIGELSDVDVAVFFSEKISKEEQLRREFKISKIFGEIFDVLRVDVLNIAEISNPLLLRNALLDAVLLYSGNDQLRYSLERKALREYEDTEYLRKMSYKIMNRQIKEGVFGMAKL